MLPARLRQAVALGPQAPAINADAELFSAGGCGGSDRDAALLPVVSEQLEDIGLAGVEMPGVRPRSTNPAVAVVVDAGDEPVMVGERRHIGRHGPQITPDTKNS